MSRQEQFLDVIDRDAAEQRFHAALCLEPLASELITLDQALGRVLAEDIRSPVDVPSFDRSNVDGFAVQAADTYGAAEERPRRLRLLSETVATGHVPQQEVTAGAGMSLATGGMLPRGADAVVMIEHTDIDGEALLVRRAVAAGANLTFAGTDITAGETILYRGQLLTSRETGVLAAVGMDRAAVVRRPRVAILSTGDELIAPGATMQPSLVYDSNARILADAVRELGGEPVEMGIVRDDLSLLREKVAQAIHACDVVLLSGGTSKGAGDLSYRVVGQLNDPGIVVHGVALKPGKPICLAASQGKPVVILPGFPTSAIFTFHEFVAPVIRRLAGQSAALRNTVPARMAVKLNSEIGRTEYVLVGLVERMGDSAEDVKLAAYPLGKGSGSVTAFSRADGFLTIGRHEEIVPEETRVSVQLLGRDLRLADLVVIGSHCVGLDWLLARLEGEGVRTKFLAVGSLGGLEAARRGECDLAGIHLLDPATGQYNRPFLREPLELVRGYARMQGLVFRQNDARFAGRTREETLALITSEPACRMVNRNAGSGTRVLIDGLLTGAQPPGYALQPRSHNAVAAAVGQGRADWGVCIATVAAQAGLGFLPLQEEQYDFVIPTPRRQRPAVQRFVEVLRSPAARAELMRLGFALEEETLENTR